MDVTKFRIIQGLIITSKSKLAFDKEKKITFKVDVRANKSTIKYAIEAIWSVKVKQVRTINVKGKEKKSSGKYFQTSDYKKAIVALKDGYSIDLPWQQNATNFDVANNREQVSE